MVQLDSCTAAKTTPKDVGLKKLPTPPGGNSPKQRPSSRPPTPPKEIIDIRSNKPENSLKVQIAGMFLDMNVNTGEERALPTLLLYDAEGLKLFERITYLEEYYLTGAEISALNRWAENIAERIPDGGVLVELGSGNLRKVSILLQALSRSRKSITYYALDVSQPELERTLSQIPNTVHDNVTCLGLHGTYDDGLEWLSSNPVTKGKKKCILWLGSSIGNFDRDDAAAFLRNITDTAMNVGDMMLVGIDGCKKEDKVWTAYNDPHGVTREFELNGLKHANIMLGEEVFREEDWDYVGIWNKQEGRHEAYFVALKDVQIDAAKLGRADAGIVKIKKGERVKIERSYKFDKDEVRQIWEGAGLVEAAKWGCETGDYNLHLAYKPPFSFSLKSEQYAELTYPTVSDWHELWKAWDTVTLTMIPKSELLSKPIDLRNPCIFYFGHIPTFLDIHVARALGNKRLVPERYPRIFERGIDPDVEDPIKCHRHSEIPEQWPDLEEILAFVSKIRKRVEGLYEEGGERLAPRWGVSKTKKLKRALWMAFEHEAMHLETLLYMLLQAPWTRPPKEVVKPDWKAEEQKLQEQDLEYNPWVEIPEREITIGMDDLEAEDLDEVDRGERHFGWDNEKPKRSGIRVGKFMAKAAPISVGDYMDYLATTVKGDRDIEKLQVPATWTRNDTSIQEAKDADIKDRIRKSFSLKTLFGKPLPLTNAYALSLPAVASYDELTQCAKFIGGRIPTREEVQSIYEYKEAMHEDGGLGKKDARKISAVNGEMNAGGVQETPPLDFFVGFGKEARVGFCGWGWESVRGGMDGKEGVDVLRGRGETGGAWEWTSSVLERHAGFVEQREYPEYTADFFDTKHNVVLGGSWATHSRLAGRRTFVNWYQRNYRYTWCTARVVKDVE
ncbi:histidine-specific methyltransferase [Kalaharituber pfeilii]|nr:histidine-specific methyltransferase [Kalaharituber pfeilii]